MSLQNYIEKQYKNNPLWFTEECKLPYHATRISGVIDNKDYLAGVHKVLQLKDAEYKGKRLTVNKTIIQYNKTILRFHDSYLLGKPVQLSTADDETLKQVSDIYRFGNYATTDYEIIDRVLKFGDAFEVVYLDQGRVKSKVLDSACSYPVYDDCGEYVAFIEHWTDYLSNVSYWNVYDDLKKVSKYSDEGGIIHLNEIKNTFGFPIHYHNFNDSDYLFGYSFLRDIKPIMDDLEDILSKLGTAVYTNSLNPMPVATGQRIESSIPADAAGYALNLDSGTFEWASCDIDHATVKLYIDNLKQFLNDVASIPSALGASANISNVGEESMKILMMTANLLAEENKKWLNIGFSQRFKVFADILSAKGIEIKPETLSVIYNISMPIAESDMINNLKTLREMGCISRETVLEKSDVVGDSVAELERLREER